MDNNQAILNFIGIARRASKIVSGQDKLLSEIRSGKVHFLFIASDSGKATQKKFTDKSNYYHVPVNNMYTKAVLSNAIGMKRTIIGISDRGMAKKLVELTDNNKGE
ncbi:L7Ae/L30e/S12e/Gadd45 family ribosomal protein [Lentilactobacillus kisonensis]|uniref:Ribosomal protein L7Ae n=1 Tax=Lentilactobacillus kisonensis F0435 TaxID=797516 RepID=H1LJG4_9LACO|nr:ribosomal L7Ae/L30e/S12e/Gadd45 family protein [Lentilactobacillus kisonensis]EHO48863.1 ribosomal protein L7Ae [Lentilactobacillus kisonensis F0435]